MQACRVERDFGSQKLSIETGKIAKQAHGAAVVRYGETMVLVTAVEGPPLVGRDFFPLTVDYREKTYAAGKFPGGFIKREGRPTTKEILTSRLIDRPIRPLFPADYLNEVQVMASTLSADPENDPDVLAMIGSSAALHLSQIPFLQITGSVRVGRVNGEMILMPTHAQLEESDLDLIVSGTRQAVTMIEGFAREMPEDQMLQAILFAHRHVVELCDLVEELRDKAGLGPKQLPPAAQPNPLVKTLLERYGAEFRKRKQTAGKAERAAAIKEFKETVKAELLPEGREAEHTPEQVAAALYALEERIVRDLILEGKRIDGRSVKDIRPIECEVGLLPRTHGSALFQRGETQALVTTVLGTSSDEQRVDGLMDEYSKKFMLDYNFPPYSVGEAKPIRGPGRREIGHGALAERSLKAVIPGVDKFPYTIRVVSDITESNGSSSMASVCGASLSLMDAGVPLPRPVAGIAMGLIKEPEGFAVLSDILGDEDHLGDMDFKVAGTERGITALQMDIKITSITEEIMRIALEQAKEGRAHILGQMALALTGARGEVSGNAPRITTITIPKDKIREVIGSGGKVIREITETTGAKVDIEDDGTVKVAAVDAAAAQAAIDWIRGIVAEPELGVIYTGKVVKVVDFGAFVNFLGSRDGLVHISELAQHRVAKSSDVVKVGDSVKVKVLGFDDRGKVKLSMRQVNQETGEDLGPRREPPKESPRDAAGEAARAPEQAAG
ncbi:MAG TPA: polyribonucleotide nucleotidyltransferase [Stellaceae bacterium]|nr:polyribonucleotide nucleotidyltransferase [Stellaceae bacterium]